VSFAANLSNTVTFIVINISLISAGKQWRAMVRDSHRLPASSLKRIFFFVRMQMISLQISSFLQRWSVFEEVGIYVI